MSWIFENVTAAFTSLFLFFLSLFLTNVIFGLIRRQKNPAFGLFYVNGCNFVRYVFKNPAKRTTGKLFRGCVIKQLNTRFRSVLGG